tara:strand:- start:3400 stop:4434 length:1035 start_codon:yes stop_codon:yes gene_type:complete
MAEPNDFYNQFRGQYGGLFDNAFGNNPGALVSYRQGDTNRQDGFYSGMNQQAPFGSSGSNQPSQPRRADTYNFGDSRIEMGGVGQSYNSQQMGSFLDIPSSMLNQVGAAALSDLANTEDAVQQNFMARQNQIDNMENLLSQIPEEYSRQAKKGSDRIIAASDQYREDIEGVFDEYEDRTAEQMSAASLGMQRNAESQSRYIENGMNPDGTRMTPQQQQAARETAQFQNNQQRQVALGQMANQFNESRSQMKMAGYGQAASFGTAAAQAASQYEQMALSEATKYLFDGRQAVYNMVAANPHTVVSKFDTYTNLYALQLSSPGIFNQPGMMSEEFIQRSRAGQIPV